MTSQARLLQMCRLAWVLQFHLCLAAWPSVRVHGLISKTLQTTAIALAWHACHTCNVLSLLASTSASSCTSSTCSVLILSVSISASAAISAAGGQLISRTRRQRFWRLRCVIIASTSSTPLISSKAVRTVTIPSTLGLLTKPLALTISSSVVSREIASYRSDPIVRSTVSSPSDDASGRVSTNLHRTFRSPAPTTRASRWTAAGETLRVAREGEGPG